MVNTLHESAVVPQIQGTIIAYVHGERSLYDTQFVLEAQLQDLSDEIAQKICDEFGALSMQETCDVAERHKRSVYTRLLIGAERHAREGGASLGTKKIEKLLRLLCWMCDTVNELETHRPPPTAREAA